MMNSIRSTQSSQIWRPCSNSKVGFLSKLSLGHAGSCHLFPDLGEGLEDGWQVEVLGRVQVPSNVVHHLKCGLRERDETETESFEDRKKELP